VIEVDHAAVIDLTRRLVRIPSTADRGEAEAAALVAEVMAGYGWEPTVEEVAPGRPNVVARVDGDRPGPTLLFCGHLDVVTPGDPSEWTVDPFGAEIVDGRLYGRGAADMKGGVAAMIEAVRAVERAGPFPGSVRLAILCDEEGMMAGAKALVAAGHVDGVDGVIVGEPEGGEVCVSQKGAIRLRIDATGKMAHGAMPHEGRNPIPALAEVVAALGRLEAELQRLHGRHPHLGLPYVTPTVVEAGSLPQLNVIPRDGSLAVDVRTVPGVDHGELLDRVRSDLASVAASSGVELAVSVIDDRPPTVTPTDVPVVEALVAAHEQVTGERPPFGGVPGTTDGTILHRDAGVPVVVYGPGGKWIAHQADEFVELDDLTRCADVFARAALEFLTLLPPP